MGFWEYFLIGVIVNAHVMREWVIKDPKFARAFVGSPIASIVTAAITFPVWPCIGFAYLTTIARRK